MGLFQRIIGTRTADQFVFHYSQSLVDQEIERTVSDYSTISRPLTPEIRSIVQDQINETALNQTRKINADIAAARLHKSKNVGFLNKKGVQIGERVRGRDVARRTSMFALPDSVLSAYGLEEVGTSGGHHVTIKPGGEKHTRSYKNVK